MRRSSEPPRAVVDTNLFVSGTILRRGSPFALLEAWRRTGAVRLITSRRQLEELARALRRPRIRKYGVSEAEIRSLLRRLASRAEVVAPQLPTPVPVRDPLDEHILGIAVAARADYLVTGDDDLLVLAGDPRLGTLKIVTVARFLTMLQAQPPP